MFRIFVPCSLLRLPFVILTAGLLTACQAVDAQRGFVSFARSDLDQDLSAAYGVDLVDMDGDGRLDVLALAVEPAQLAWYRNPDWQKFPIPAASESNIDAAAKDIDGDGDMDLVLASDFSLADSETGGSIHWLENPGAAAGDQEWQKHLIDQLPTAHRLAWGDLNGDGEQDLVVLPIVGIGASAPRFDVGLQLKAYPIPPNLELRRWPGVVLDRTLQMAHGMALVDWDDNGREDILTASFGGIRLFRLAFDGQVVSRTRLGAGLQEDERPAIGASEIAVGQLSEAGRFLASIEPWHGNQLVVYTPPPRNQNLWQRSVIDTALDDGHALQVADLDGDGDDEILAGGRGEGSALAVYDHDPDEGVWRRMSIDTEGLPVSGLAVGDIDGDQLPDVVSVGGGAVVLYRNQGP